MNGNLLLRTGSLKVDVRLLDPTGKVVATLRTRTEVSSEKSVSVAQFPAGMYLLEVTTEGARGVEKLQIQ